jgi:Domain of unknown function (DUF4396)
VPPGWLTVLALVSLVAAIACAALILGDIYLGGRRQRMGVMEAVWPITALYAGPAGLWAYWALGRAPRGGAGERGGPERPFPIAVALGVMHCGGGCTLGDIIGASAVALAGVQFAGLALWPELLVDYLLAFVLGIAFQYFSIAPMRGLGLRDGVVAALKADALSLTAFEVGLFGWMILMQLVLFPAHVHPGQPAYWLMMQIGMLLGFVTAYPVNWWLIRAGIKERM